MKRNIVLGLLIAGIAVISAYWAWPRSDESLAKTIVGTWRAIDPNNGALHKRSEGVKDEQASFRADGTLTYTVESDANERPTKTEKWGWRVRKGRLQLQYLGEGSAQAWMRPVKFSVSETKLSIRRKNYPAKTFNRVSGASPTTSRPT